MANKNKNPHAKPGSAGGDLPRDRWPDFFNDFSRDHKETAVTVEVETSAGTRQLAEGLGLIGITANLNPDEDTIDLSLDGPDERITHLIHHPRRVHVAKDQQTIDIESPDGTTHVLLQDWGFPTRPSSQSAKTNPTSQRQKEDSGLPGDGKGRRDVTGKTNVYPASGPLPAGDAPLQPMGTFGQGDRGPEGYFDSGESEIIPNERLRKEKKSGS